MASPPVTEFSGDNRQAADSASLSLEVDGGTKSGLRKVVPASRADREAIRRRCRQTALQLDKSHPLSPKEMVTIGCRILDACQLNHDFLGWTMVILASEFWRDQITCVPVDKRLLLLPHCMRHADACPADYDGHGLDCRQCGECHIGDLTQLARQLGYQVLVAEGSPVVLQIILSGQANAILGVACLNVLEKVLDNILLASIPCAAVPLLSSNCHDSTVDEDWVREMILQPYNGGTRETRTYVHLMRRASSLFTGDSLQRLAPRTRHQAPLSATGPNTLDGIDPIAGTEALAYDFLAQGGKCSRPFITLAVYDALTGEHGTGHAGAEHLRALPDPVLRTAVAIETFHKASLVHDDIEDDDPFRYGQPTLHRQHGIATAINVGDYLIGMGYRLMSREAKSIGAQAAMDILGCLADAHTKLAEGQGAELLWRDSRRCELQPIDALKIYALKTAPAFEAAMLSGIRLATELDGYIKPIKQFARDLGIAFQILNDLKDWREDPRNKRTAGNDVLGGRPTLLWALAWEALDDPGRQHLGELARGRELGADNRIVRVRQIYHQVGAFTKAHRLVEKYRLRAAGVACQLEPAPLRRLFQFLIDAVLSDT